MSLSVEVQKKLERIGILVSKRNAIDLELAELMGMSEKKIPPPTDDPVIEEARNSPELEALRKSGIKHECCGSHGTSHKKGCSEAYQMQPDETMEPGTQKNFTQYQCRKCMNEFSSADKFLDVSCTLCGSGLVAKV